MFDVLVVWVRWGYIDNFVWLVWVNFYKIYLVVLLILVLFGLKLVLYKFLLRKENILVYLGKYWISGIFGNFCLNKLILLRKRMMDVCRNYFELIIDLKRISDFCIWFWKGISIYFNKCWYNLFVLIFLVIFDCILIM